MDALRQQLALHRVLFTPSRWSHLFAILMTLAALWIAFSGDAGLRTSCELMSAVAISFWIGAAVQRIPALAIWAGQVGIPHHRGRLRSAQLLLLIGSLTFSILLEIQFARDLRALVIPLGSTAVIMSLATLPLFAIGIAATTFIVNNVDPQLFPKLFEPISATIFIGICLAVIVHWFRAVRDLELRAAVASQSLADAGHERAHAEGLDPAQALLVSKLDSALLVEPPGRASPQKFWIGMGYELTGSWKVTGYTLLFAMLSFTAFHFYKAGRCDTAAYAVLSALVAIAEFGRFSSMHEAWMRTPQEQALLLLAPRWPQGHQLKQEFLRSQTSGYPRHAVYWSGLSVFAVALGTVEWRSVMMVGVALLLVVMSICVLFMHYVSRRRASQTSAFAIFHALMALTGVIVLMAGWAFESPGAMLAGISMVVVPALLPVHQFWMRRLQFPVQPTPGPTA